MPVPCRQTARLREPISDRALRRFPQRQANAHRIRFTFFILNFSGSRANSRDDSVTLLFAIKRLLVFPFNHRQEIIRSSLKTEETLGFLFPTFSVLVR